MEEKCYESVAYKSLTTLSRKAELTRGFDYDELLYTKENRNMEMVDTFIQRVQYSRLLLQCMNTPCARKVMRCWEVKRN